MIDWLDSEIDRCCGDDRVYLLDAARAKFEVRELIADTAWLVLKWDADKFWLHFAALDFQSSDSDGKNTHGRCVFHGEGPTGALRECRHTYWGEDGYIFYVNGAVISAAFKALAEFYDEMA